MILKQCFCFLLFTVLCELFTQRLLQDKWLKSVDAKNPEVTANIL